MLYDDVKDLEKIEHLVKELDVLNIKIKTLFDELKHLPNSEEGADVAARKYKVDLIKKELLCHLKDSYKIEHKIKTILANAKTNFSYIK